jgi:hypothetical protein
MKSVRFGWVGLIGLGFLAGCGGQRVPLPADPGQAQEALLSALNAWVRGENATSLRGRDLPIHVVDGDWDRGLRLEKFQQSTPAQASGPHLRCPVHLSLRDKVGRSYQKQVVYLIETSERISIVREEQ